MTGISFATVATPDSVSAPSNVPDKANAFASAFSDVTQTTARPVEAKSDRSDAKDEDRKTDKDEKRDDATDATGQPTASASTAPVAAHPRDAEKPDGKKSDAEGTASKTVAGAAGKTADKAADAEPAAIDMTEAPVDAAQLAPVLDALKQAASATPAKTVDTAQATAPAQPVVKPDAATAEPLPGTASLLAARFVPAAAQADAKPATPAKKNARAEAAADKAAAIDATATTISAASTTDHKASTTPDVASIAQPDAGQQLAAGGADRALDMAKQGAWLDGLARDIASTGDSSSTLRFQAAPERLGAVQVEIARGLEGAAVTLTASSESSRVALADAKPQLIAEARAQGIHIASAQVDVSTDSRQSGSGNQPEQRHDPRAQAGLSSQAGGGDGSNAGKQTRSQPFTVNQTIESQPAPVAEAEEASASGAPAGGMYA